MMKHLIALVFLIITTIVAGQQQTIDLEWDGTKTFTIGNQRIDLPHFKNGFVYQSEKLKFSTLISTNGNIDPLSASFSNIQSQVISSSELLDLDRNQIASSAEMSIKNALSRKRTYAHIEFNPIYRDGNSYRRINSFTISYQLAPLHTLNLLKHRKTGSHHHYQIYHPQHR